MTGALTGPTLSADHSVGIAVTRTSPSTFHTGIVYRYLGKVYLFHQAWHNKTEHGEFDQAVAGLGGKTLVVSLRMLEERESAVTEFLKLLSDNTPCYRYSLRYDPVSRLLPTGEFQSMVTAGLTCSNFVLAVFHTCQSFLIDYDEWPDATGEDREFQSKLVAWIEISDPDHAAQVSTEIGCKRIRPDQVGGTGYFDEWPVAFEEANLAASEIVKRI